MIDEHSFGPFYLARIPRVRERVVQIHELAPPWRVGKALAIRTVAIGLWRSNKVAAPKGLDDERWLHPEYYDVEIEDLAGWDNLDEGKEEASRFQYPEL